MLTPVSCQVNALAMVDVQSLQNSAQTAQQLLTMTLLQPLLETRRPERVLLLNHEAADSVSMVPTRLAQIISMSSDECDVNSGVRGRLSALPFGDETFDLIVLQHLVEGRGCEVLREAIRVLAPAGDIVISGLNATGLRYRLGNRKHRFPGLDTDRIIEHLKSQSFKINRCLSTGLAGLSRPLPKDRWHGLMLPFADRVVLHGHHHSNIANASILRFKSPQRSRVASAALDGVSSRKIAS